MSPQSSHLEARGPRFPGRYVCVIVDLELRHNGDGRLDDEGDDVRPHLLDVHAFGRQPVQHAGEGALAARVLAVGVHEVAAVHVEGVVGQVHEDVGQVLLAWFLEREEEEGGGATLNTGARSHVAGGLEAGLPDRARCKIASGLPWRCRSPAAPGT